MGFISIAINSRRERMFISNVYIYPHATTEKINLLESKIKNKGNQIILGDFNAHCKKWSKSTETKRGKLIEDMIKRNKLVIVNNKKIATMCKGRAKTLGTPDLILAKLKETQTITSFSTSKNQYIYSGFTINKSPVTHTFRNCCYI